MRKALLALGLLAACATHRPIVQMPQPDPQNPLGALSPGDDAQHPSTEPAYFEWWYYDATFEDGSTATVALYAAEMVTRHPKPAVLVNLLAADGTARISYKEASLSELSFGGPGEVAVAGSSARKLPDGSVRVQASGVDASGTPLAVDLTFTPEVPGFKIGDGAVHMDGKVALAWVVPMPRARVSGTVTSGGNSRQLQGLGYHDHNWGELNLIDTMAYWYWGRIATEDTTLIYADVHFRPELGAPRMAFVAFGDGKRIHSAYEGSEFSPQAPRWLAAAARDVPQGLKIQAGPLSLVLKEHQVLEADNLSLGIPWIIRPFVRIGAKPAYIRSLSDYELTGKSGDGMWLKTGSGAITEYMYLIQP